MSGKNEIGAASNKVVMLLTAAVVQATEQWLHGQADWVRIPGRAIAFSVHVTLFPLGIGLFLITVSKNNVILLPSFPFLLAFDL